MLDSNAEKGEKRLPTFFDVQRSFERAISALLDQKDNPLQINRERIMRDAEQLIEGDNERTRSLPMVKILAQQDGRDVASALFTAMKVLDWKEQFARLSPENRKAADLEDYLDEDLAEEANRDEEEMVTARDLFPDLDKTARGMQGRRERYVALHMQKFFTRLNESVPVDILLFTKGVGSPPGHRLN